MYLFLTLLALVIALPYIFRAMAKNSQAPRSRPAQGRADLPVVDLVDSAHHAGHDAGHDCGGSHSGADGGGCDAGGHH
jgi:hypothetical protein